MAESIVAALLAERAGYLARGLHGRVAQVDAALAHYGVAVEQAVPDEPERPAEPSTGFERAVPSEPKTRRRR